MFEAFTSKYTLDYLLVFIALYVIVLLQISLIRTSKTITLKRVILSLVLYCFFIYLFIFSLVKYLGFIDNMIFFLAFGFMMVYVFKLKQALRGVFLGVLVYVIFLPLCFEIETMLVYDILLGIVSTIIFPLRIEPREGKK